MKRGELHFSLVTRKKTDDVEFGRVLLNLLKQRPGFEPQAFGLNERRMKPFGDIDQYLAQWGFPMIGSGPGGPINSIWPNAWKRRSPVKYYMYMSHFGHTTKGQDILGRFFCIAPNISHASEWSDLFSEFCSLTTPVLGRLHHRTARESPIIISGTRESWFWSGPSQIEVDRGIVNLGWANFFGDEFASGIDIDRIRSCGYRVDLFKNGCLIYVSDDISIVHKDFVDFVARREILRAMLPPRIFMPNE